MTVLETQGRAARIAARQLAVTGTQEKNAALLAIADALISRRSEWLAANAADLHAARAGGMGESLLDRLALDEKRIAAIAEGVRQIAGTFARYGYVMDTHTAVACHVCEEYMKESNDAKKCVIASTASPYKFVHSVMDALE